VSYTERFDAKVRRFTGAVAERWASVGGFEEKTADKTGADELEWLKINFSAWGEGFKSADSVSEPDIKERGGRAWVVGEGDG
jgi:hypothetical protein